MKFNQRFFAIGIIILVFVGLGTATSMVSIPKNDNSVNATKILPRTPPTSIKQTRMNIAYAGSCNFDQSECTGKPYDCHCNVDENEFLQASRTYSWEGIFPPGTPICVYIVPAWLPLGASAPQVQGTDEVTMTLSWTPDYCQSKSYTPIFHLSFNCTGDDDVFADFYVINVANVNREPFISTKPSGFVEANLNDPVHIDVTATDADTACTDPQNMDVLALAQTQGPGNFVDNGNGNGDFDWNANQSGNTNVAFSVNDGKGGIQNAGVEINVLPVAPQPVQAEPVPVNKNRYISFVPNNGGKQTAIRVKLESLNHPIKPKGNERSFSGFEGQYRWVGPAQVFSEGSGSMETFNAAQLQCDPFYTDWESFGLVHVFGEEILPSSIYQVQAIELGCDENDVACFAAPLENQTSTWGDVVAPFQIAGGPTQPDISDISGVLDKFKQVQGAPIKAMAQLQPQVPNPNAEVNFSDISEVVNAFKGQTYPFDITANCT